MKRDQAKSGKSVNSKADHVATPKSAIHKLSLNEHGWGLPQDSAGCVVQTPSHCAQESAAAAALVGDDVGPEPEPEPIAE